MTASITKHEYQINRENKEELYQTKAHILWLTGLSGSGKSTIANEVEKMAFAKRKNVKVLDGDNIRLGLCKGLSFSDDGREENLRRIAEVAKLFVENGTLVICSFITPLKSHRDLIETILGVDLSLVFIDTPIHICETRDPKGLYKNARAGKIKNFTGVDSIYERPLNPKLSITTEHKTPVEAAEDIFNYYLETIK